MQCKVLFAALPALGLAFASSGAPISGTGFSVDTIVEFGVTDDAGTDYNGWSRWVMVEEASAEQGPDGIGLPPGGLVTSQFGTQFQLEAYDGPNTLINGDTFTLDTPAQFTDIQFFITGIGGNTTDNFTATLNFSDATTTDLQFTVNDWQGSRPYNAFTFETSYSRRASAQTIDLWNRELAFTLDPGDQLKTLESIDFTLLDRLGLSAVSGTVIPEPTSMALLGLGGLLVARRRR